MIKNSYFYNVITNGLKNCFDFSGRASRSEFWLWNIFIVITTELPTNIIFLILQFFNHPANGEKFFVAISVLCGILSLTLLIPMTVRRFHDVGLSGYMYFWGLLPVVGFLILLWFFCKKGQPFSNEWGPQLITAQNYKLILLDKFLLIFILFYLLTLALIYAF